MKPPIMFRALTAEDILQFVQATQYCPSVQFGGIAAYTDKAIMGAVGFDDWTKTSVSAHWWIRQPRCILPLWYEAINYLASHGKKKIIGATPGDNERALRMIFGRLGFREIARIKDGWDDGIDIVLSEYRINQHARHTGTTELRRAAGRQLQFDYAEPAR